MLDELTIHGPKGSLLWGYRTVAGLRMWRILKGKDSTVWILTATLEQANTFECKAGAHYKELLFTAPRDKGRWCWPLVDVTLGSTELRATLGPPEQ